MTVHAVSNPTEVTAQPLVLHNRAPGYGIIGFDRATRRITVANWPRWVDASRPGAKPYEGWPITIHQQDNGLPRKGWTLPALSAPGMKEPVVQVTRESDGELLYTFRLDKESFAAPVPGEGTYILRFFDPDGKAERVFRNVQARKAN